MDEFEILSYKDIKGDIENEYKKYLSKNGIYKFSYEGATSKIINEYQLIIWTSEVEKIMIYAQLAIKGLDNNQLIDEVRNEIIKIIQRNNIEKYKEQLNEQEYNEILRDLESIKNRLLEK